MPGPVVLQAAHGGHGIEPELPLARQPTGIDAEGVVDPRRLAVTNGQ
jgi:hypothetical protein